MLSDALRHHQAGRFDAAERLYRRVLASVPDESDALHLSGVLALQRGHADRAIRLIRRAIRRHGENADFHYNLGVALQESGQLVAATFAYCTVLVLVSDHVDALNNLGNTLVGLGRADEACVLLSRARSRVPDDAKLHYNLSDALDHAGRWSAARASGRAALVLRPGYAKALDHLGLALRRLGMLDQAERTGRRAIRSNPRSLDASMNLAKLLWNRGRTEDAVQLSVEIAAAGEGLPDEQAISRQESETFWAIRCWIEGVVPAPDDSPKATAIITRSEDIRQSRKLKFTAAYRTYLAALRDFRAEQSELYDEAADGLLYAIGDSHVLSPNGIVIPIRGAKHRVKSRLIVGMKMWHLADENNKEASVLLSDHVTMTDPCATILFCIGEIDCRRDEGIWYHCGKENAPVHGIVRRTVSGYLSRLSGTLAGRDPGRVIIQGVPAPKPAVAMAEPPAFLAMVVAVNRALEEGALASGFHFLDIYSASRGEDGARHPLWDLDGTHLKPNFYRHAEQWLKSPGLPWRDPAYDRG